MRGAGFGIKLLEIGTHYEYTALRITAAFPSQSITTIEMDPIQKVIARNMVALSGLVQSLAVWTGHSKHLLPRLAKRRTHDQQLRYGAVYIDRWGSEYHDDFVALDSLRLLERGSVLIALHDLVGAHRDTGGGSCKNRCLEGRPLDPMRPLLRCMFPDPFTVDSGPRSKAHHCPSIGARRATNMYRQTQAASKSNLHVQTHACTLHVVQESFIRTA